MIFKSFIVEKNISLLDDYHGVLFYGENIGLKDDFRDQIKNQNKDADQLSFHQTDIVKNPNLINEQVLNNSLFNKKKIIFVYNFTEKFKNIILEITKDITQDVKIILFSDNLDKKSVVRSQFEKGQKLAVVPCYQDNEKTLSIYIRNKLKDHHGLSQELVNILIKNSGNDRKVLSQEIDKITGLFSDKKIDQEKVISLINNAYNVDFDQLRDSSLEADKQNLNKNLGNIILQNEKSFLYLSNLNNRIEKLLDLNNLLDKESSIDSAMDLIKPKIFWKDKPIFKKQLKIWNKEKLEKAKRITYQTEIVIKTKLSSLSDILIKKLLIELCQLADTRS
tara:strand:+ start:585 stop:1589 length:1005 start_codon:yes stop_codon:yes gene_type:complete